MQFLNRKKLPLTANWWREEEKKDHDQKAFYQSDLEEALEENHTENAEDKEKSKDSTLQRDTTIDSGGTLDISNILYPIHSLTNKEMYEGICEKLNCSKSKRFVKTLNRIAAGANIHNINMSHYGLSEQELRAIILTDISLFNSVNLEGNKMTEKSMLDLIVILKQNQLTELNLSHINLAKFGSKHLASWLTSSKTIKNLYLRNNNFDDNDGIILFEAMTINRSLQTLDVAENKFSTFCGSSIKKMIEDNDSLEFFDVSWNHLRLDGAFSLSKALKKNSGLKTLILSWNGFEDEGIKHLASSIQDNEYLEVLEIACNRITDIGFAYILKALEKNSTLKILKIGQNSISQESAEKCLQLIKSNTTKGCNLEHLDFSNIIYRPSFKSAIDSVKESKSEFTCVFGYVDYYGKRKLESYDPIAEAIHFMKVYLEANNINLLELFEKFDIDGSMTVNYDEFRQGLKKAGIPMSDSQVNQLIQYLDFDGDGEIDFSELVIGAESQSEKETKQDKKIIQ